MDEFSLYAFYHEIQHTRQVFENVDWKNFTGARNNLMEIVNDWTARRNYIQFLKMLGRDSIIHGDIMKRNLYGYGDWIVNFDTLLKRLEIKDDELIDKLTILNETERKDLFIGAVSSHLENIARDKKVHPPNTPINEILEQLDSEKKRFRGLIK